MQGDGNRFQSCLKTDLFSHHVDLAQGFGVFIKGFGQLIGHFIVKLSMGGPDGSYGNSGHISSLTFVSIGRKHGSGIVRRDSLQLFNPRACQGDDLDVMGIGQFGNGSCGCAGRNQGGI